MVQVFGIGVHVVIAERGEVFFFGGRTDARASLSNKLCAIYCSLLGSITVEGLTTHSELRAVLDGKTRKRSFNDDLLASKLALVH